MWFLGGRQHTLETNQSLVDLVESDEVSELGDVPTPRGGGAAFFVPEVGACLAGGEASNTYRPVECIDETGAATSLPDMAQRRHGLGAAVVDGTVYLMLGGPVPGYSYSYSGTVQILDPD